MAIEGKAGFERVRRLKLDIPHSDTSIIWGRRCVALTASHSHSHSHYQYCTGVNLCNV